MKATDLMKLAQAEGWARRSAAGANALDGSIDIRAMKQAVARAEEIFNVELEPRFQPIKKAVERLYRSMKMKEKHAALAAQKEADSPAAGAAGKEGSEKKRTMVGRMAGAAGSMASSLKTMVVGKGAASNKAEEQKPNDATGPQQTSEQDEDEVPGAKLARQAYEAVSYNSTNLVRLLERQLANVQTVRANLYDLARVHVREAATTRLKDPIFLDVPELAAAGSTPAFGLAGRTELSALGMKCETACGADNQGTDFAWCVVNAPLAATRKFQSDPLLLDHRLWMNEDEVSQDRYWDYCSTTKNGVVAAGGGSSAMLKVKDKLSTHHGCLCAENSPDKMKEPLLDAKYYKNPGKWNLKPGDLKLDIRKIPIKDRYTVQLLLSRFEKARLEEKLRGNGPDGENKPDLCQRIGVGGVPGEGSDRDEKVLQAQAVGEKIRETGKTEGAVPNEPVKWPFCVLEPNCPSEWARTHTWDLCVPKPPPVGSIRL
eukprot:g6718.t1